MARAVERLLSIAVASSLFFSLDLLAKTEEEFIVETEAHILRVVRMGRHLLNSPEFLAEFPEYAQIDRRRALQFFALHDAAKIRQDRPTARSYDLPTREQGTMAQRLGALHGQDFAQLPEAERREAQHLRERLNRADAEIAKRYMHSVRLVDARGVLSDEARLLLTLEKALDSGDRYFVGNRHLGESGRNEFGRAMKPASEFLSDDRRASRIARFMETSPHFSYSEVTHGLDLRSYMTSRMLTTRPVDYFLMREAELKAPPLPLVSRARRLPSHIWGRQAATGLVRVTDRGWKRLPGGATLGAVGVGLAVATAPLGEKMNAVVDSIIYVPDASAATLGDRMVQTPGSMDAFFALPLDEQANVRLRYPEFHRALNDLHPEILGLQCREDRVLVELKAKSSEGKRWLELLRDPNGKFVRVDNRRADERSPLNQSLFLDDHERVQTIRFAHRNGSFSTISVTEFADRQSRVALESRFTPQRVGEAEQAMRLFALQQDAIVECCRESACVQRLEAAHTAHAASSRRIEDPRPAPGAPGTRGATGTP